jgi:hypothetical protein
MDQNVSKHHEKGRTYYILYPISPLVPCAPPFLHSSLPPSQGMPQAVVGRLVEAFRALQPCEQDLSKRPGVVEVGSQALPREARG